MRHLLTHLSLLFIVVLASGGTRAQADEPSKASQVISLLTQLRAQLEHPGLDVEEAAKNLATPQAALAFVQDEVVFMPYRGAYHGANGTLRTRVANAVDKAVLLKGLLDQMQVEARLVRAPWPADADPHHAVSKAARPAALAQLQALLAVKARQPDAGPRSAMVENLRREVASAFDAMRLVLESTGEGARLKGVPTGIEATRAPRHWVWVEAKLDDKTWSPLDPVFPTRTRPEVATAFAVKPVQTTVRLLANETAIATWSGSAFEAAGFDAQLQLLPLDGKVKAMETPEKITKWVPALRVGSALVVGQPFVPGGKTVAPKPAVKGLFGSTPAQPGHVGAQTLRLELTFDDADAGEKRSIGRTIQRFDPGFDPQQLVAYYRITTGVANVPAHVMTARTIDELLDTHTLKLRSKDPKHKAAVQSNRGTSSRSARILNSLFQIQPALVGEGLQLGWNGPAVVVESFSLKQVGDALKSVARIDIWQQAFTPRGSSSRAVRAKWGLATLAVEGHLLNTMSVNQQFLAGHGPITVVPQAEAPSRFANDEIALAVHNEGGLLLSSSTARHMTWSLRPTGDVLGTLRTRGTAAKGGEAMNDATAAGVGGVASAIAGATGNPAGMLVGGIASYLNELRKVWGGVTKVLEALGDTIESGDDRYILEAIGAYRGDIGRRLSRAFAEGAVRGYAESVIGAGVRPFLPGGRNPYGPTVGDRAIDGAVAGGLGAPQDLPVVSDTIGAAADAVFNR